jgi:hypothetical protein
MKNKLLKLGLIILNIFIVSCASNAPNVYYERGAKFATKEEALLVHQNRLNNLIAQIQPFEKPLVNKRLIVSIPTTDEIYSRWISILNRKQNEILTKKDDQVYYWSERDYENNKSVYDMIKKKNIYKTVELVDGSYSSIIQPSPTCDTLCNYSSGKGNIVWFMLNVKNGKQVFAYDTSLPEGQERNEALLNAVKAFALQ